MSSEEGRQPQTREAREAPEGPEVCEDPEALQAREMLNLTDPKAIRALAHPVRMALLELFAFNDTLTATQASEALGESPANCAFHLRTLAKYGYVREAGGGRGRERPWAVVHRSLRIQPSRLDPQAHVAATALQTAWLDRWLARVREAALRTQPAEWEEGAQTQLSTVFLTPVEAAHVGQKMREILDPYVDRLSDPSLRPAGSVPVDFGIFAHPRDDIATALAGKEPPAGKETDE